MVLGQKNSGLGSSFSGNPEKIPFLVYKIIKLAASTQSTHVVESGLMAGRWVKGGLQGQGVFVIKVGV